MEDHVNWPTAMGTRILINDGWYKTPRFESGRRKQPSTQDLKRPVVLWFLDLALFSADNDLLHLRELQRSECWHFSID